MASRLWVADYAAKNEIGKVLDFNELAESSGDKTGKGIKRLGVLRADVDGLGAALLLALYIRRIKSGSLCDFIPICCPITQYGAVF